MRPKNKKIIAVLPAYNAAKTLGMTVRDIPTEWIDEIILVDDGSCDQTVKIARALGLRVVAHGQNRGYGANQKTCYSAARRAKADIIIMIHPDHQYDPSLVPQMLQPLLAGECEAVFGSRMITPNGWRQGGMPRWKFVANRLLTMIENRFLGLRLTEYHSGFRAYQADIFDHINYRQNSDNFVFDTEIIVQLKIKGWRIKEIAIPTRYFAEASSVGVKQGIIYGLGILRVMGEYTAHQMGIVRNKKFI